MTSLERRVARRYIVELLVSMAAYVAVLLVSLEVLQRGDLSPPARDLLAVAPVVPAAGIFASLIRFIQSIDELQRRMHVEAFAIAAGVTAALGLTYGFLEGVGFPHVSAWWAFLCVDVSWGTSLLFLRRRYR